MLSIHDVQSAVYRQIRIIYEARLKEYSHRIVTLAPPPMSRWGVPAVLDVKNRIGSRDMQYTYKQQQSLYALPRSSLTNWHGYTVANSLHII
jgi:hypothetical protein